MTVPSDPPAAVSPGAFKTWAQDVSDTSQDHDTRLDALESGAYPRISAGLLLGPRGEARTTLALGTTTQPRMATWMSIEGDQPIDQIRWHVAVVGDASSVITAAIYKAATPGSSDYERLAKTAAIAATSPGFKAAAISATTLTAGLHLVLLEVSGFSSTLPTVTVVQGTVGGPYSTDPQELLSDPRGGVHWTHLDPAATLPESFTLPALTSRQWGPVTYLRAA